jgi:HemY protein
MRAIIWLLTLFAVAVALALAAKMPSGLVSIFVGGYRLDLSLNLAAIALVFAYAMIYIATKGIATLLELPKSLNVGDLFKRNAPHMQAF